MSKNPKIWLSSPHMGAEEWKNVQEAFHSNWIAPVGPFLELFEEKLAAVCRTKGAAVVQSGTAGIHLALEILGVENDDIVLCQSFTFIGSVNPVLYCGATPVFIDSEEQTWNMCPQALEDAIVHYLKKGIKPKAIIAVDLYGMPANMKDIMSLAKKHEIPVIEDAAEALGASIDGKPCGSFGDLGILSFNGNKIITTSGGGAILSNSQTTLNKVRFLATQAKDDAPHYEHTQRGYNYRMSNVLAAIGVGQLEVLQARINARRTNYKMYRDLLSQCEGIDFLQEPKGYFSNRWLSCILVNPATARVDRETIRLSLSQKNIESRPLWKPMHLQPLYEKNPFFGSGIAETLFEKGLCLPSGSNLTNLEKERITNQLKALLLR